MSSVLVRQARQYTSIAQTTNLGFRFGHLEESLNFGNSARLSAMSEQCFGQLFKLQLIAMLFPKNEMGVLDATENYVIHEL